MGLEDLILVSDRIDRQGILGDQASLDRLVNLLDPFFQIVKVLSGSELAIEKLWPVARIPGDERVAFVLEAWQEKSLIAFLYFERMSLELHVPEHMFVTGATDTDRVRFHHFIAWADSLSKGIDTAWSVLEIAGEKHPCVTLVVRLRGPNHDVVL